MKRALAFFASILLLVVFVGCDNTPPHEDEHVWDDGVVGVVNAELSPRKPLALN